MYLGWALPQLGAALVRGSGWMIAAVPAAAALVHRAVRGEERMLEEPSGMSSGGTGRPYPATCRAGVPAAGGDRT
jgi:hypothetical protein